MNTPPIRVRINLQTITASSNLNLEIATPNWYLWTVFFKIDGDTVHVVLSKVPVQGPASVVGTSGDHGDLPFGDGLQVTFVVSIPASLGDFRTVLAPIQTPIPGMTADGVVGCVAVLMEHQDTPDGAVAQGHSALNSSLQQGLNSFISKLSISSQTVTSAEVKTIENQVSSAVTSAVTNALSDWDKLVTWLGLERQDSQIGTAVYYVSASELASSPPGGISVTNGYPNPQPISWVEMFKDQAPPETRGVNIAFNGTITGDALPLSLKRILTRFGQISVRTAMAASVPPWFGGSVTAWVDALT